MTIHTPNGPAPDEPEDHRLYTLRVFAPRPMTRDELLRLSQVAAAEVARLCNLPAGEVAARVEPPRTEP
jgi:hypothetical protein